MIHSPSRDCCFRVEECVWPGLEGEREVEDVVLGKRGMRPIGPEVVVNKRNL